MNFSTTYTTPEDAFPYSNDARGQWVHGTWLAGLTSSLHNGTGVAGLAPDARLLGIKVQRRGDYIRAVEYARVSGADVIVFAINVLEDIDCSFFLERDASGRLLNPYAAALERAFQDGVLIVNGLIRLSCG